MKVYIKKAENSLFEQAKCGFIQMGYEIVYYNKLETEIENDSIVVGFISDILNIQKLMQFDNLKQIDYPTELIDYLYRDFKIISINNLPDKYPYFIKPISIKSFSGRVIKEYKDLIGTLDTELYFTETIYNIISEYRCFILNGELIGVKHYKGSPFKCLQEKTVLDMIDKYKNSPNAYSMDIGITECGKTILIECNNGYSTGNYGMSDIMYAKFLKQSYLDIAVRSPK
jgi:hypothetical protein